MSKLKIALLSGGTSGEREVSLKTGNEIFKSLDKNKYEIFRYDLKDELKKFVINALDKKFDFVLPALHGPFGEDGKLQGMLDLFQIPYLFSGTLASALAMNKHMTKILARNIGIPVPNDVLIRKNEDYNLKKIISFLKFPIVVKPVSLGSSVGINIAKNEKDLKEFIKNAFTFGNEVLLEQYISGCEITSTVMGNKKIEVLPLIEIVPKKSEWFDYKAKYEAGAAEEICPANIPEDIRLKIQEYAVNIYKALGCKDLARADFIWDNKSEIFFIEINTIPGMTSTSLAPQAAEKYGYKFNDFLDKLIANAVK